MSIASSRLGPRRSADPAAGRMAGLSPVIRRRDLPVVQRRRAGCVDMAEGSRWRSPNPTASSRRQPAGGPTSAVGRKNCSCSRSPSPIPCSAATTAPIWCTVPATRSPGASATGSACRSCWSRPIGRARGPEEGALKEIASIARLTVRPTDLVPLARRRVRPAPALHRACGRHAPGPPPVCSCRGGASAGGGRRPDRQHRRRDLPRSARPARAIGAAGALGPGRGEDRRRRPCRDRLS